ncbi:hypothetical protein POTOM_004821 [Populus tomentosa]|uniref:Uncharacterized protein n=1 Tax=Populus tomentosa TaxID=118781 RepID=A0A8X8AI16_POPTO|nr:hypothetical protein POTOM_004821 [Populus tomentosa]
MLGDARMYTRPLDLVLKLNQPLSSHLEAFSLLLNYKGSELHNDIHKARSDQRIQSLIGNSEFLSFVPEILGAGKNFTLENIKAPFLCTSSADFLREEDGLVKKTAMNLAVAGHGLRFGSVQRSLNGERKMKMDCPRQRLPDTLLYIEESVCSCASLVLLVLLGQLLPRV